MIKEVVTYEFSFNKKKKNNKKNNIIMHTEK